MAGATRQGLRRRVRPKLPRVERPPLVKEPFHIPMIYTPPLASALAGSLPEKMVYDWLRSNEGRYGIIWSAQDPQLGGRQLPGGAVVDVVISAPVRQYWRIQGAYFHLASAGVVARDRIQKIQLSRFGQVLDLWEQQIYADVGGVCRDALMGIERPPPDSPWVGNRPLGA